MNWRRGFKRVAACYLAGALAALAAAFAWDISSVDCPAAYHYTAEEMHQAEVHKQLEAKTAAVRGKCDVLSPDAASRRRWELETLQNLAERNDSFAQTVRPLPPCPAGTFRLDPIPRQVDTTVVIPADEVRACWVSLSNWARTARVGLAVVLIPLALSLSALLGLALFRLGRWLYRGFRD